VTFGVCHHAKVGRRDFVECVCVSQFLLCVCVSVSVCVCVCERKCGGWKERRARVQVSVLGFCSVQSSSYLTLSPLLLIHNFLSHFSVWSCPAGFVNACATLLSMLDRVSHSYVRPPCSLSYSSLFSSCVSRGCHPSPTLSPPPRSSSSPSCMQHRESFVSTTVSTG
jgi:hypothetical protein